MDKNINGACRVEELPKDPWHSSSSGCLGSIPIVFSPLEYEAVRKLMKICGSKIVRCQHTQNVNAKITYAVLLASISCLTNSSLGGKYSFELEAETFL